MTKKLKKLNREDAIEYLEDKEEIEGVKKYSKEEEAKIRKAMSEGVVYSDPVCKFTG